MAKQCNCTNSFKIEERGKTICAACGDDWPNFSETCEKEMLAKELYFKHIGVNIDKNKHMWKQCSHKYRNAWITIAEAVLNDTAAG